MIAAWDPLEGAALLAHPIAAAIVATIHDRGYATATVEEFMVRAEMTRREFDHHFAGKDEAALRVLEAHIDAYVERAGRAYDAVATWPDNLRAAAYETTRYILENPEMTWFGMVGVLEADDLARARRDQVFSWAAGLIDAGRGVAPDPTAIPRSAAMVAVGAIVEALRRTQESGLPVKPVEAVPVLMYAAVRPYLGEETARAELVIAPPADLARREER
ncbi:MAG TPA: hypothetical protein VHE08_01490 [Solirubrobacterales bacterium]|nr:hypothetical protein [Solirubrobacterales bacterium]